MGAPSAQESEKWEPPRAEAPRVSIPVSQGLLLLLLLGVGVQGSTPGSRCDCAGDVQRRYGPFCCRGCPMGHYLKARCTEHCGDSTCLPCPRGTFLARENHYNGHCTRCQACDEEGFGRDNGCGPCPPGFYEHSDDCVSCPTSILGSCPEPCAAVCGWRPMFWVQVLVAGLLVPFLLGVTFIYLYWRCQPHKLVVPDKAGTDALTPSQVSHLSSPDSTHALLESPGNSGKVCTVQLAGNSWTLGSQEAPCQQVPQSWDQLPSQVLVPVSGLPPGSPLAPPLSPAPPAGSPAAMLQPGPQLYDVMDAVPARRWKEFVRTLGLREAEIEAVEVEIGRFRDQQYEMLKRWRQQQPAGLGAVYAALERMGLDGCAEDLRLRLQRGP
ncbi:tumor necrosis factor receptor superfamily member 25 isoform X7 [Cavia porcellus]|uniref:tumor necrosis factor receptor superfamily member 25 isoform X7 n=1 Tax=Cavia porcellus TaxID=10141 RepID=UPI000661F91C|nr:tumor necrosis factor receptor superfamily member 25 isoform X5 [Cavia porcellus]